MTSVDAPPPPHTPTRSHFLFVHKRLIRFSAFVRGYSTAFVPVWGKPVVKEHAVGDPDLAVHSLYLSFFCNAIAGCKHTVLRIYYYVLMAWSLPVWLAQYEKCI